MVEKHIEKTLDFISQKGYSSQDNNFLNEVCIFLAQLLDVNYIIIDKYSVENPKVAEMVSFYQKDKNVFLTNKKYALKNTPCDNVINKSICSYQNNLATLFPKDQMLVDMKIESYVGIPLWSSNKQPIGLIAIMDNSAFKNIDIAEKIIQIIAIKVEKILEKILFQDKINLKNIDLEETETRLSEAQKIAKVGSFVLDVSTGNWESSDILNEILGININFQKNKQSIANLVHPSDRDTVLIDIEDVIIKKIPSYNKEYRIIRDNDQKTVWIHSLGKLVQDANGNSIKIIGSMQDITKRKQIEEELVEAKIKAEKSELLFKTIIEQAGDAMFLSDVNGNIVNVNTRACKNLGYSKAELLTMKVSDLDGMYTSLTNVSEVWDTIQSNSQTTIETIHKHKNGSVFPVEVNIGAFQLGGEKLFLGFARDISLRKKISRDNKLLSAAVSQSANVIVITDSKGNIEYTNPKFSEVTGYSAEEALGQNPRILNSGKLPKSFYTNLWATILAGEIWQGQFHNISKSGEIIWEQSTITPIINEQGIITNFLAIKEDISEKIQSEINLEEAYSKIKESEDYLKRILQTANEGFWIIDTTGVTIEVNAKLCQILEYEEKEFVNKSIFNFVDSENVEIFKEQLKNREQGLSTSYEIELTTKKGKKVRCLFNTSPIYNNLNERLGSFALVTDITKLKIASNKLKTKNKELNELSIELYDNNKLLIDSRDRYLNIFEHTPVSIFEEDFSEVIALLTKKKKEVPNLEIYLNENLNFVKLCISKIKILNVNESCLNLFGVKDIKGLIKHFQKTNNEKSFEALKKEFLAIANNDKTFITETEFLTTKGEKIIGYVKLALIGNKGKAIATIIDITNIKKTENELIIAKEKAEESNRLKTAFLNNMSHEIRTPMNGILGFSELLNNENLSPVKRNYFVSIIQNSGKQLLQVIDDILEISRLGTKQVKVLESKVCLNDLLLELFSIFDLKAKENGVPLYVKNQLSDCESTIYTDKGKLQKIISNLLENALKFTNKGNITFGYQLVDNQLEIFVRDTGIGIKPEKIDIIFERFSQEEKDLSRNASGLGLGLSIAKENTELLGGEISVESTKWEGSTFWVKIPYKRVKNPNKDDCSPSKEVDVRSKYKVLIVEDEEVNYLFIEIILTDKIMLNCDIIHARNGKEALDICKNETDIDFVLMDINMPVMDGYESTRKIREFNPNLPIIAQTAYSTPEDKEKALAAGCNNFISKPINKDELKSIIDSHLIEDLI